MESAKGEPPSAAGLKALARPIRAHRKRVTKPWSGLGPRKRERTGPERMCCRGTDLMRAADAERRSAAVAGYSRRRRKFIVLEAVDSENLPLLRPGFRKTAKPGGQAPQRHGGMAKSIRPYGPGWRQGTS